MCQGADEVPVQVNNLVESQQGGVVRSHPLVPDLTVLGDQHVSHHVGEGSQPSRPGVLG